ncbi:MAG: winged helix-turn-helix domain-containing protein [Oricola sp.]
MASERRAIGPFVFDPARGLLRRDDEVVTLGGRAAAILQTLLDANGAVVAKGDLIDAAWPDLTVEEGNLTVQIATLRKALGTMPDSGEWIVTVPRVGYRLVASEGAAPAGNGEAAPPALAVLPFDNLGGDREEDYFADGVVADIVTALSRYRSFIVISRNAAAASKGSAADIRDIAARLGARYVLEGSVRRAGGRLRLNAQLVDGATAASLWSGRFEGAVGEVFEFQDRITESVATTIRPVIDDAEFERSRREWAGSVAVYDLYLRALARVQDESAESNAQAVALLERALAREPDNAALLALGAWALEHRITMGWPPIGEDDAARCLDLARRGLARAGGDARLMAMCGMALLQTGKEYDHALAVIRAAAVANPNDLHVLAVAGTATMHCGDMDEAMAIMHRAIALAPNNPGGHFFMTGIAMMEITRGRHGEAVEWAAKSLALNAHFDPTWWMLIAANAHLGRMDEARRFLAGLRRLAPGVTIARIAAGQPAKHPERIGAVIDGLRLAGMEEA